MKTGILLTNLGSPEAPTPKALKKYLKEFLWDKRVVDVFRPLWWLILNGIILNVRPAKSARLYASIWMKEGSPLLVISKKQKELFAQKLLENSSEDCVVALAMRYGKPSVAQGLQELLDQGVERILVFPLYPQYSHTTTGSTKDAVEKFFQKNPSNVKIEWVGSYSDHPDYVNALTNSIQEYWQKFGKPDKLVFSYHGLPQRYVRRGDPYFHECLQTTRAVVQKLNLKKSEWKMVFQSRFGKEPWLKPYADEVLENFAKDGVQNIHMICPAFSADCLETYEEVNIGYRELFLEKGGKQYHYIPALNTRDDHIAALVKILAENF